MLIAIMLQVSIWLKKIIMKKRLLSFNFLLLVSYCCFSQSVGIGTTAPDASAALDVTATNTGLLIPGMNMSSINAITNPARGLGVYDSITNPQC